MHIRHLANLYIFTAIIKHVCSLQKITKLFQICSNLQNQFPTREQRLELSRVCNDAELAMNNGAMIRGPEGDTEGITEQRINTWFTNRRKGLTTPVTPSPTKGMAEKKKTGKHRIAIIIAA